MSGNVEDVFPLAPLQGGLLFHSVYDPDDEATPYVAQHVDELTGSLDASLLAEAWQRVVNRHGCLRTCFVWEDVSEPVQVVLRSVEASFTVLDWASCPPGEITPMLQRFTRRDRRLGFDLGQPPLHRVTLIRTGATTHLLVMTFHHLLLDGWSVATMTAEFFAIYAALLRGEAPDLKPPASYGSYIEWLSSRSSQAAHNHWRAYLSGYSGGSIAVPARPACGDRLAPVGDPVVRVALEASETKQLRMLCRQYRLTVNTVVQAAFGLVLGRLTGHDDVLFGGVVTTRPAEIPDVESIVGMLINTLPVRIRVDHDARVADWLGMVQQEQVDCRQYDYAALSDIQEWLGQPAGRRLFDCLLTFQNYPSADPQDLDAHLPTMRRYGSTERSDFPLSVIAQIDDRLQASFTFDPKALSDSLVRSTAGLFIELVRAMIAAPEANVGQLPALAVDERETIVQRWSGRIAPSGTAVRDTVHTVFEGQVDRSPDAPAVVFEGRTVSYGQLDVDANRLAHHLIAQGTRRSSIVGICVDRNETVVSGLLAVLKSGGAYMLLDPTHPDERLRAALADARPTVLVTTTAQAARFDLTGGHTVCVRLDDPGDAQQIAACPAARPRVATGPDDPACVMFTSGSSGRPKAVMAPHRALTVTHTGGSYLAHGPAQTYLQSSPVPWDAFALEVFSALFHGGTCVLQPGQSPDLALVEELVSARRVSALQVASSLFNVLVDEQSPVLRTVGTVMVGAEAASPKHAAAFLRGRPDATLVNGYGPVESLGFTTTHIITPSDTAGAIPIGRPIEGKQVYVLDRRLRPVPAGVIGELYAAGDGLALGYLHQCALTAERFVPCPFGSPGGRMYRTGDLACWREDGILTFHGRADDQVKIRGFRVEPREVESILAGAPGVARAAVVGRDDEHGRKQLVGYVTGSDDRADGLDLEAIRAYLRRVVPQYMVPADLVTLPELPFNGNGKVDRGALPAPMLSRSAVPGEYVAPRTAIERDIAAVWADVLHRERVGRQDNFFALGGDSLASIRVVSRLRRLGVTVTPRALFESPTIADLGITGLTAAPGMASSGMPADRTLRGSLLPLNHTAAAATVFCLPYGGGSVTSYLRLAELLGDRARVYGLEDNASDYARAGGEVCLGAVAARFLEAIRAEQPHGPYHLVGWSLGGVFAHEVARLARAAGEEVGLVCVIDSVVPVRSWRPEVERDLASSRRALSQLDDRPHDAPPSDRLVRELATLNIGREHLEIGREHLEMVLHRSMLESSWLLQYYPDRADHDMILYQAASSVWPCSYVDDWRLLVGAVDHRVVPGGHRDALVEPNVTGIAEVIAAALGAQAGPVAAGTPDRASAGGLVASAG